MMNFIKKHFFYFKILISIILCAKVILLGLLIYIVYSIDKNKIILEANQELNKLEYGSFVLTDTNISYFPYPYVSITKITNQDSLNQDEKGSDQNIKKKDDKAKIPKDPEDAQENLGDVKAKNPIISLNKVTCAPSFWGMLTGDLSIYYLKAENIEITLSDSPPSTYADIHPKIIEILNKTFPVKQIQSDKLVLNTNNSQQSYFNSFYAYKYNKNFYLNLLAENNVNISCSINYDKKHQNYNSDFAVSSKNIKLNGSYLFNDAKFTTGNFVINTRNLLEASKEVEVLINIPFKNLFANNININIQGDIVSKENIISFDNVIIKGTGLLAKATLSEDPDEKNKNLLSVTFAKLSPDLFSLDKLIFDESNSGSKKNIAIDDMNFNITINELSFNNISVSNMYLEGNQQEGGVQINYGSANYNQNGQLYFSGFVENTIYRPRFKGHLELNGDDTNIIVSQFYKESYELKKNTPFYINGDLAITPKELVLSNLLLRIDDKNITGNLGFKRLKDDNILIGDLYLSNFDINDNKLTFVKKGYDYLLSLVLETQNEDYNKKFAWIRSFPFRTHIGSHFKNLFLTDGTLLEEVRFSLDYSQDKFQLLNMYLRKGTGSISADLKIFANSLKPVLYFNINDLNYDKTIGPQEITNLIDFARHKFNPDAFELNSFINIDTLNILGIDFSNIKFDLNNKSGNFSIYDGSFNMLGGNGNLVAVITLNDVFAITFSGALEEFYVDKLSKYLNTNLFLSNGIASFNSS
ncbi:MAG: hypothetical protein SFT68_01800, partial [Rickettsiaceae bacterium]|nr:hypothetical protein [Rickettsiaceae bacterium]